MRSLAHGLPVNGRCPPLWGFVAGLAGVALLFRALYTVDPNQVLWGDSFDSRLLYWTFEWGYHALFQSGNPLAFWHSNQFFPVPNSLAFSDSLLGAQAIYSPLRFLGLGILPAVYGTLATITVLGCCLSDVALRRLGFASGPDRVALVVGAHFGLPMTGFLYHYQLFGFELLPPFLLFFYLWLRDLRPKDLVWSAAVYAAGVLVSTYFAPMALAVALLASIRRLLKIARLIGFKAFFIGRIGAKTLLILGLLALALYAVQFQPYFEIVKAFPRGGYREAAVYSANWSSLFTDRSIYSQWYAPSGYGEHGDWERAYFPGLVWLGLGGGGLLLWITTWFKGLPFKASFNNKSPIIHAMAPFMAAVLFAAYILSLGPVANDMSLYLPFHLLGGVFPGLESVRAPGRFGLFFSLPMAFFALLLVHYLIERPKLRAVCAFLLALALGADSLTNYTTSPFKLIHQEFYDGLAKFHPAGEPLLDLPVAVGDKFETISRIMDQLDASTRHWGRLVTGYGSRRSDECEELIRLDGLAHADPEGVRQLLHFAHDLKIPALTLHLDDYPLQIADAWRMQLAQEGAHIVFTSGNSIYVRFSEKGRL